MKNLSNELMAVYNAKTLTEKKNRMQDLIDRSHAKNETKNASKMKLVWCTSKLSVDKFATNYMLSGEGMKI